MRTIQKPVYYFDELDDDLKKKVLDNWRSHGLNYYDWWDAVYEDSKEIGRIMGIDIDDIFFSGFWCQGDGACFVGRYNYKPGSVKAIKEYAPQDTELHEIAQSLYELQRPHFYRICASIKHSGHHYHEYCTEIDVNYDNSYDYPPVDIQDAIVACLRDLMRWIYRALEHEHEYLSSDDAISETIRTNGYEFDEDGNIV